jgi:hypothetical protein
VRHLDGLELDRPKNGALRSWSSGRHSGFVRPVTTGCPPGPNSVMLCLNKAPATIFAIGLRTWIAYLPMFVCPRSSAAAKAPVTCGPLSRAGSLRPYP